MIEKIYPPTEPGLAQAVTDNVFGVASVEFKTLGPGQMVARLHMRWWAWLAVGFLHVRAFDRARAIFDRYKAAGTTILVAVW